MNSTSDSRPTATTEALPHHLRRGGTSPVLDLLPDRFPVVRHRGEDLGDLGDVALTDLRTAQTMSTGTNRTWLPPTCRCCPCRIWAGRPVPRSFFTGRTVPSSPPTSTPSPTR